MSLLHHATSPPLHPFLSRSSQPFHQSISEGIQGSCSQAYSLPFSPATHIIRLHLFAPKQMFLIQSLQSICCPCPPAPPHTCHPASLFHFLFCFRSSGKVRASKEGERDRTTPTGAWLPSLDKSSHASWYPCHLPSQPASPLTHPHTRFLSHTHTHTHTLKHTHNHTHSHTLTHSLTHTHTLRHIHTCIFQPR